MIWLQHHQLGAGQIGKACFEAIGVQIYHMMYEGELHPVTESIGLGDIIRRTGEARFCFIAGGMQIGDVGWDMCFISTRKKKVWGRL